MQCDYSMGLITAYRVAFPSSEASVSGFYVCLSLKSHHQQLALMYDKPHRDFLFRVSPF
jgi:hypothetical protein